MSPVGASPVKEPGEQSQVHSADELGVLLRQGVEGAVGEGDVVTLSARFEAVFLQDPQCGLPGITVVGGAARRVAEFLPSRHSAPCSAPRSYSRWPGVTGMLRPTAHCIDAATAISCYDTKWMMARRRARGRRHPGGVSCSVIAGGRHCQRPRTRSDRGFGPRPLTRGRQATPTARSPPVDLPGRSLPRGSAHRAWFEHS